jgi:hypothetical protein
MKADTLHDFAKKCKTCNFTLYIYEPWPKISKNEIFYFCVERKQDTSSVLLI